MNSALLLITISICYATSEGEMNKISSVGTNDILVSVIIPAYNCLAYLPHAIESVLSQKAVDFSFEIIVCDDNSTDGTWQWLTELALEVPQLIPLKLTGVGPAKARNLALQSAKGKYIAYLDADDIWTENKLNEQISFHLANPEIQLSFTNYLHINEKNENLGTCFEFWPKFKKISQNQVGFSALKNGLAVIFAENVIGTSTVIATKIALQNANGFDEELPSAEDWDLWLKLASEGKVGFCPEVNMQYLMRTNSESCKQQPRLLSLNTIYQRYEPKVKKIDRSAILCAQARKYVANAEYQRALGNFSSAAKLHLKSFLCSPSLRGLRAFSADLKQCIF